jgi:hypothetical protein
VEATFFAFCSRAVLRPGASGLAGLLEVMLENVPWRAPPHNNPSLFIRPTRNTRATTLFGRAATPWVSIASLNRQRRDGGFCFFYLLNLKSENSLFS